MTINMIDRVALALGKGEVESSILSRSTSKNPLKYGLFSLLRKSATRRERAERRRNATWQSGENPGNLFAARSPL
jgi:hypothetical protein